MSSMQYAIFWNVLFHILIDLMPWVTLVTCAYLFQNEFQVPIRIKNRGWS